MQMQRIRLKTQRLTTFSVECSRASWPFIRVDHRHRHRHQRQRQRKRQRQRRRRRRQQLKQASDWIT